MSKEMTIGILGGMGTYATIHMFQQYAKIFKANKEWERPRIIIDNRCTMPSRVRAFLYNEKVDVLVNEMTDSMKSLANSGCNKIILACNTSHLFLPKIYKKEPELEKKVIHLVETCVNKIKNDGISKVYLLASEGTIVSHIYQDALSKENIECIVPKKEEYVLLRQCIEAVKQNEYSDDVRMIFINLINRYKNCILGCTELPILYSLYRNEVKCVNIYDPLLLALEKLKKEYDND